MSYSLENPYSTATTGLFIPRSIKSSSIDEMLNRSEIQLEDLMNEEDFIFEFKNGNPRLLDYLTRNINKIQQLIDYIIKLPPDLNDNKRSCQYPLLAFDIFETNNPTLMNTFFSSNKPSPSKSFQPSWQRPIKEGIDDSDSMFGVPKESVPETIKEPDSENQDLLSYLFEFVNTKDELNPVLAGYFNKVVQILLQRNPRRVIGYVYANEKILLTLADNVGISSIAELLPFLLSYESYIFDENHPEYLETKYKVIDKIINILENPDKPEEMSHVSEILFQVIQKNEIMADGKEIIAKIISREVINKLFVILKSAPKNTVIMHVGNVILTILGYYCSKKNNSYQNSGIFSSYLQRGLDDDPIILSVCDNLESLSKLLTDERRESVMTTYGQSIKSLGLGKLKVVEIIEKIIKIDSKRIYSKINEIGIIKILTDLFGKLVWNNMLHIIYEKIIYTILDKRNSILLESLFEKGEFVKFLINQFKEDQYEFSKNGKKIRKGNMGSVIKITNELVRLAGFEKRLEDYIKKELEWEGIVLPSLQKRNELNNILIGGFHPRNLKVLDDLSDDDQGSIYSTSKLDNQPQLSYPIQPEQKSSLPINPPPEEKKRDSLDTFSMDPKNKFYSSPIHSSHIPGNQINSGEQTGLIKVGEYSLVSYLPSFNQPISNENLYAKNEQVATIKEMHSTQTSNDEIKVNKSGGIMGTQITSESEKNIKPLPIYELSPPKIEPEFNSNEDFSHTSQLKNEKQTPQVQSFNNEVGNPIRRLEEKLEKASIETKSSMKLEIDTNIIQDSKPQHFAEESGYAKARPFDSYNISPIASSGNEKSIRNSMLEMKSGKKVKLRVKKTEKLDGSKILEMINNFKGSNTNSMIELSCSDNSQSESGNLVDDVSLSSNDLPEIPSSLGNIKLKEKEMSLSKGYN